MEENQRALVVILEKEKHSKSKWNRYCQSKYIRFAGDVILGVVNFKLRRMRNFGAKKYSMLLVMGI